MAIDRWTAPIQPMWTADGTALASSVAATIISPTPNLVIPANTLVPGMFIKARAAGQYSTTGTPTLTLAFYWGTASGTAVLSGGAQTTTNNASAAPWTLEADIQVRTVTSTGTTQASGAVFVGSAAFGPVNQAASSLDMTAATAFTTVATWSASSASNTITLKTFTVELL